MDKSSLLGVTVALGGILLGLLLEGGGIAQIIQPTAAMIVFGGTFGAVMIQFPLRVMFAAAKRLGQVFVDNSQDPNILIQEMVGYAQKARKEGIISLDNERNPSTTRS
jgi:chemotaxis protein MotA